MALLDVERGTVVLRIVYDGPAMSGKTTSLRSLAGSLGREMFSADEAEGRTLFFDWVDYTGGRFNGYPIRCQLVSVPGQRALRSRRESILETADAVVFVADSRRSMLEADIRMAEALRSSLGRIPGPTPGVVIQANKRDDPEAASMADLRQAFEIPDHPVAIMESTATDGVGIRETFIFAVRLALDRVRELMRTNALTKASVSVDSGEAFLAALMSAEAARSPRPRAAAVSEAAVAFAEVLADEERAQPAALKVEPALPRPGPASKGVRDRVPDLPTTSIPGGMIWPPVGGRIILQGALSDFHAAKPLEDGGWRAESPGWRLHSYSDDVFDSAEESRTALLEWARLHAGWSRFLSQNRCIVSAPSAEGSWRLWQIVGSGPSLGAEVQQVIESGEPAPIASALLQAAEGLVQACQRYSPLGFAVGLDSITTSESGGNYLGLAPGRRMGPLEDPIEEVLRKEFASLLGSSCEIDVPRVLSEISRQANGHRVGELLSLILIGH